MRGLALNQNLIDVGATFAHEDKTAPIYRLWSIEDKYPAMMRAQTGGAEIELWNVPDVGMLKILQQEPPGLVVGRVKLLDDTEVLDALAEPNLIEYQIEITAFGGWRKYIQRQ